MKNAANPFGNAAPGTIIKAGPAMILPLQAPTQTRERVSPELARLAALTRRPADRIRLGKHRRKLAAYRLRRCA